MDKMQSMIHEAMVLRARKMCTIGQVPPEAFFLGLILGKELGRDDVRMEMEVITRKRMETGIFPRDRILPKPANVTNAALGIIRLCFQPVLTGQAPSLLEGLKACRENTKTSLTRCFSGDWPFRGDIVYFCGECHGGVGVLEKFHVKEDFWFILDSDGESHMVERWPSRDNETRRAYNTLLDHHTLNRMQKESCHEQQEKGDGGLASRP